MKRTKFKVVIELSDKELDLISRFFIGVKDGHMIEPLKRLSKEKLIRINPNFQCGLGSDINEVLSLGMKVIAFKMHQRITDEDIFQSDLTTHSIEIKELSTHKKASFQNVN